jgi:hypothetical protein
MGEQKVHLPNDKAELRAFIRSLLDDVHALEKMLKNGWFEQGVRRIGAEQEMVLIDQNQKPANVALEALALMNEYEWLETELAQFNLEITLTPQEFSGDCLSNLEKETVQRLGIIRDHVASLHAYPLLTGILPTLRKSDLSLTNLTPKERYKA